MFILSIGDMLQLGARDESKELKKRLEYEPLEGRKGP